jgi:hypothetical protein
MGAALDSFILILSIAGPIALLALIWSLVTRLMSKPKDRGFLQRFPVLLPAVLFIISVIIISQIGILPMSQYKGTNYLNTNVTSGEILRFNIYEPTIVYSEDIQLIMGIYLIPGESINITAFFYLEGHLEETINTTLTASGTEDMITEERVLDLSPGMYLVQVNNTFFDHGVPDDMPHWLHVTLSQHVDSSFVYEIVSWSSVQFGLNVGCFFLILGGFCIGGPSKSRYTGEEELEEQQTGDDTGGPEYGKGC